MSWYPPAIAAGWTLDRGNNTVLPRLPHQCHKENRRIGSLPRIPLRSGAIQCTGDGSPFWLFLLHGSSGKSSEIVIIIIRNRIDCQTKQWNQRQQQQSAASHGQQDLSRLHNQNFLNFSRAPFNYFHPFCFPHNSFVMQLLPTRFFIYKSFAMLCFL